MEYDYKALFFHFLNLKGSKYLYMKEAKKKYWGNMVNKFFAIIPLTEWISVIANYGEYPDDSYWGKLDCEWRYLLSKVNANYNESFISCMRHHRTHQTIPFCEFKKGKLVRKDIPNLDFYKQFEYWLPRNTIYHYGKLIGEL